MILGWSFYVIGRLRPPFVSCQSFPSCLSYLPFRWMVLHLSMILPREDSPITATGNSFAQSDRFTWVHIRREHCLTSMILFRMASKTITRLITKMSSAVKEWCYSVRDGGRKLVLAQNFLRWSASGYLPHLIKLFAPVLRLLIQRKHGWRPGAPGTHVFH